MNSIKSIQLHDTHLNDVVAVCVQYIIFPHSARKRFHSMLYGLYVFMRCLYFECYSVYT